MNKTTRSKAGIFFVTLTLGGMRWRWGWRGVTTKSSSSAGQHSRGTLQRHFQYFSYDNRAYPERRHILGPFYSQVNNSSVIAGAIQGTGTSLNGNFSSTNALDFNVEARRIDPATVSTSYVAKQSIDGTITYPTLNHAVTFTSTYDATYDSAPNLAVIAGTYSGTAAVLWQAPNPRPSRSLPSERLPGPARAAADLQAQRLFGQPVIFMTYQLHSMGARARMVRVL